MMQMMNSSFILRKPVRLDEEASILITHHNVLPDCLRINFSEVSRLKAIVLGRQRDAYGRRDEDVGPTSEELGVQMV